MALFSRLRQSFEATKQSYEAGAAKAACLLLAGAFALAAAVVWFVQLFGAITACLFFSGAETVRGEMDRRWQARGRRGRTLQQMPWKKMLPALGDSSPECYPASHATQLVIRTPKAIQADDMRAMKLESSR